MAEARRPGAAVHLSPRERGPIEGRIPFSRVYIAIRSVTLAFEIATLGYVIWMTVNFGRGGSYAGPTAAVSYHLFSSSSFSSDSVLQAVVAVLLDAYVIGHLSFLPDTIGGVGACFNCGDIIVLGIGIVAWISILLSGLGWEQGPPPWSPYQDILAFMVMGVWYALLASSRLAHSLTLCRIAHGLLSVLNLIGCCVACGRAQRAKRRTTRIVYMVPIAEAPVTPPAANP
jgi:hypothetical protein